MIKAPKGKRRQSSSQRLDVVAMNRNRVTFDGKMLVIQSDDGRTSETIRDKRAGEFSTGVDAFSELFDVTVQIPRGQRVAVLSTVATRSVSDAVAVIARKTGTTLGRIDVSQGYPICPVTGPDLDGFAAYLAGHSDTAGRYRLADIETPKATAGGTQHERECIQAGLSPAPLGKDYSQGRNQPSAALPISGQRRTEDIDRPEWKESRTVTDRRCNHRLEMDTEADFRQSLRNSHKGQDR